MEDSKSLNYSEKWEKKQRARMEDSKSLNKVNLNVP